MCAATCDGDGDGAFSVDLGGDDCDDGDAAIGPDAAEACDGVDNNCDGQVDESGADLFVDGDGDGFGDPEQGVSGCPGEGLVDDGTDCNDAKANVFPGAPDDCDDADNDCDKLPDPLDTDNDGDGVSACAGDCNDADVAVNPSAEELCNGGVDDDCDTLIDDADDSANVWSCGYCPPWEQWDTVPIHLSEYNPCVIASDAVWGCNPDTDTMTHGKRLHRVLYREDMPLRDQLFVFLPPGPGDDSTILMNWVAYAGYRTLMIGYPNTDLDWAGPCQKDTTTCYADGRTELLWGIDAAPPLNLDIQWSDSIVGRTVELLDYLEAEDPTMGWASYHNAAGDDLAWDRIILMGWSEGGNNTAYALHAREAYAGIVLSTPEDTTGFKDDPLAPYLKEPNETPSCAIWGFYHEYEHHDDIQLAWDTWQLPGPLTMLEDSAPPYGGSHQLKTALAADPFDPGCTPHGAMAKDLCMSPLMAEPYITTFCAAGYQDRTTECPWNNP